MVSSDIYDVFLNKLEAFKKKHSEYLVWLGKVKALLEQARTSNNKDDIIRLIKEFTRLAADALGDKLALSKLYVEIETSIVKIRGDIRNDKARELAVVAIEVEMMYRSLAEELEKIATEVTALAEEKLSRSLSRKEDEKHV